jgi:hypothetical protein
MTQNPQEHRYSISSIGLLYRKSLQLFAQELEDLAGHPLTLDQIQVGQRFMVVFASGTGRTRTSAIRIQ